MGWFWPSKEEQRVSNEWREFFKNIKSYDELPDWPTIENNGTLNEMIKCFGILYGILYEEHKRLVKKLAEGHR